MLKYILGFILTSGLMHVDVNFKCLVFCQYNLFLLVCTHDFKDQIECHYYLTNCMLTDIAEHIFLEHLFVSVLFSLPALHVDTVRYLWTFKITLYKTIIYTKH